MARTNISVDQNIFDAFSVEAARQNKTLFAFANESLSVLTKVASEGGSPSDLYSMWRSMTLLKQFDVITLPADFVDDVTAELYASHKEATLKRFSEIGSRFVTVLKIFAPELLDLTGVEKDFRGLLPIKQLAIKDQGKGTFEIDGGREKNRVHRVRSRVPHSDRQGLRLHGHKTGDEHRDHTVVGHLEGPSLESPTRFRSGHSALR